MTHVLIAVDRSEDSVRTASTAHDLFGDDATYSVVSVAEDGPVVWGSDPLTAGVTYPLVGTAGGVIGGIPLVIHDQGDPDAPVFDPTQEASRSAADVAKEAGLPASARPIGEQGDPAEAILDTAKVHHADVIVVGSNDRGWLSRLVNPSVASEVARDATVPVLVVH